MTTKAPGRAAALSRDQQCRCRGQAGSGGRVVACDVHDSGQVLEREHPRSRAEPQRAHDECRPRTVAAGSVHLTGRGAPEITQRRERPGLGAAQLVGAPVGQEHHVAHSEGAGCPRARDLELSVAVCDDDQVHRVVVGELDAPRRLEVEPPVHDGAEPQRVEEVAEHVDRSFCRSFGQ